MFFFAVFITSRVNEGDNSFLLWFYAHPTAKTQDTKFKFVIYVFLALGINSTCKFFFPVVSRVQVQQIS